MQNLSGGENDFVASRQYFLYPCFSGVCEPKMQVHKDIKESSSEVLPYSQTNCFQQKILIPHLWLTEICGQLPWSPPTLTSSRLFANFVLQVGSL